MSRDSALELPAALTSLVLVVGLAAMLAGFAQRTEFHMAPSGGTAAAGSAIDAVTDPAAHARQARSEELTRRFEQAVAMLHAKQYDYAVTALHRVLELSPRLPEAHVNMGFALLGLERHKAAADFFTTATELRPYQANAYWGLAVALEQLGDTEGALGAMRTYIHLAKPGDPYVTKARSALWEWESRLARGPLPAEEEQWIERRTQEWEDRNSPAVDQPAPERMIDITPPSAAH